MISNITQYQNQVKENTRKIAVQYHPSTRKNPKQSISRWSPKAPRHSTSFTDKYRLFMELVELFLTFGSLQMLCAILVVTEIHRFVSIDAEKQPKYSAPTHD